MQTDELEFLISQHFDGTLEAADGARLGGVVAADPAARVLLNEHAKLDAALRASRSTPAIDESWLSAQIAATIDDANATPLRMPIWRSFAPLAAAAAVVIGLSATALFMSNRGEPTMATNSGLAVPTPAPRPVPVIEVAVAAEPARQGGFANVSVGAPANLTPQIVAALYLARDMSDDSRVTIRAAGRRAPDAFD